MVTIRDSQKVEGECFSGYGRVYITSEKSKMMYFEACNFQVNRLDNLQGGDVALFGGVVVGMSSYTDPEDAVIALNKVISVILNQKKEGKNEWREVMKEFDIETQKVK